MDKDSRNAVGRVAGLPGRGVVRSDRDGHPGSDPRVHRGAGGSGAGRRAWSRALPTSSRADAEPAGQPVTGMVDGNASCSARSAQ